MPQISCHPTHFVATVLERCAFYILFDITNKRPPQIFYFAFSRKYKNNFYGNQMSARQSGLIQ